MGIWRDGGLLAHRYGRAGRAVSVTLFQFGALTVSDAIATNSQISGSTQGPSAQKPPLTASVAMATFNGAGFIAEQLESVLGQTVKPQEIVICDDGSTDGTPDVIARFAERADIPIHLFRNEQRLGYRANFMKAGACSASDIVFFCDQDDVWDPAKIETVLPFFDHPRVELVYHNAEVFHTEQLYAPFDLYKDAEQQRNSGSDMPNPFHFSHGFTQAYRGRLHRFDDLVPSSIDHFEPDKSLAHDQWFFFLAFLLGEVRYIPTKLARYRQHGSNAYGAQQPGPDLSTLSVRQPALLIAEDARLRPACLARARVASAVSDRIGVAEETPAAFARRYQEFAEKLERRTQSITGAHIGIRAGALAANLVAGAYSGPDRWRFRTRSLLRDVPGAITGLRRRQS